MLLYNSWSRETFFFLYVYYWLVIKEIGVRGKNDENERSMTIYRVIKLEKHLFVVK